MFGLFKTRTYRCPDGTTKTVYRNVNDAFPFFLPGWKAKFAADLKVPATASGALKGEYEEKIQGLLVKLDDSNNSMMMSFRAMYIVYQSDPCSGFGFLQREMSGILRKHEMLQRVRIQIDGLLALSKNSSSKADIIANRIEFLSIYRKILEQLGEPVSREAAVLEIQDTRTQAKKWIGGADAS